MTRVSIVIVTYNSAKVILRCLAAIRGAHEIIVVDNASSDASAKIAAGMGASVIVNSSNLGFGRACNIGAAAATGDYVLFLNPDATLAPLALREMKSAAERYPQAAAIGPRLMEGGKPAVFQSETLMDARGGRMAPSDTPSGDCCMRFLSGAALMCSRKAFQHIGGFDEAFFLYYEDDDLCFRLRDQGGALIYAPGAVVSHVKARSSPLTLRGAYMRHNHLARSRIYISRKYGLRLDCGEFVLRSTVRTIRALLTFNPHKAARHFGMLDAYAAELVAGTPYGETKGALTSLKSERADAP
ncbi:MAG: glycosyltransferase family 2 protein [Hyphomicrobiales bacterium]|nr:glycosyltransferase family 2 protein [Hyphomicrobiales bacterium]